MAFSKTNRSLHGPSWAEVFIGAALSFVLGVALAMISLILKPIETVKEMPKDEERHRGVVYYIPGVIDGTKSKSWMRKRQLLVSGQTVSLTEEELNAVLPPPDVKPPVDPKAPAAPATPAAAAAAAAAPKGDPVDDTPGADIGQPNFRLLEDRLQIAVPYTIHAFGIRAPVMVVATGRFRKEDDVMVFDPEEYQVGSLDVSRLPMIENFVTDRIMSSQPVPQDLIDAWTKLNDVVIEPSKSLKLAMP